VKAKESEKNEQKDREHFYFEKKTEKGEIKAGTNDDDEEPTVSPSVSEAKCSYILLSLC
jgi:hypothetical protein